MVNLLLPSRVNPLSVARENILRTPPSPDHDQFRRYLALSWAKSRARRERAQGKMPDPAKFAAEGGQDILMDNVRRTTALVPPASTLVGMWLVDWDMRSKIVISSPGPALIITDRSEHITQHQRAV